MNLQYSEWSKAFPISITKVFSVDTDPPTITTFKKYNTFYILFNIILWVIHTFIWLLPSFSYKKENCTSFHLKSGYTFSKVSSNRDGFTPFKNVFHWRLNDIFITSSNSIPMIMSKVPIVNIESHHQIDPKLEKNQTR